MLGKIDVWRAQEIVVRANVYLPIGALSDGMIVDVVVRFVVGSDGQYHKELTGIFTEARVLRE